MLMSNLHLQHCRCTNNIKINKMQRSIKLASGYQMPLIGLGTFKTRGYDVLYAAVDAALSAGYRSFDTASVYRNEKDLGKILKELLPKYSLHRKDVFITSKLGPSEQGKGNAMAACMNSLQQLDCEYLDLYLIHWPGTHKLQPSDEKHRQFRKESWLEMEEAHKQGKIRSLGISNYLPRHIEELLSYSQVQPSVLQIEYHPHLIQSDVKKICDAHGIRLQAYSSLGTSGPDNKLLSDPRAVGIAQQINISTAQVLLKWAVQQKIGVLPKSTNPSHIAENINIFSHPLTDEQMTSLSQMNQQKHYCWNPEHIL